MSLKHDDTSQLNKLGDAGGTKYAYDGPSQEILETFPNQFPQNDYLVELFTEEFTSNCPKTGQPDYAKILVEYVPDEKCIETKSFKLYCVSYRNHASFMETITNNMLSHFVGACSPRYMKVTAIFNSRGGTHLTVKAVYKKDGYEVNL